MERTWPLGKLKLQVWNLTQAWGTWKEVFNLLFEHCNEKENVERYNFFPHIQATGDGTEEYYTNLRVLAGSCNFGTVKESLMEAVHLGNPKS